MVKKFSKIGVCMVFVLSMILPQAAVSKAKTSRFPRRTRMRPLCSRRTRRSFCTARPARRHVREGGGRKREEHRVVRLQEGGAREKDGGRTP